MYQIGAALVREFHHDDIETGTNYLDFPQLKRGVTHGTLLALKP